MPCSSEQPAIDDGGETLIIEPKCRGFICTTAHPTGCQKNVEEMAEAALAARSQSPKRPQNVLVLGASAGYGLASRVVAAFSFGARTVGVSFEREAASGHTATAGWYNNRAFDALAAENGLAAVTLNGDAFSDAVKDETIAACRKLFNGQKIDLLVYSLAAPRRTDPQTGETYSSVIKPVGSEYHGKTVDFHTGTVSETAIAPASEAEIAATIKVMGGEDWALWIERLIAEGLVAEGFVTVAYSYIGPTLTHAIYRDGTIGHAKDDLMEQQKKIDAALLPYHAHAYVSVNKAVVTQASAAIPVVPLYISLLYKVMKEMGSHEGCFEQMHRLYADRVYGAGTDAGLADSEGRIRLDDYEMRDAVQDEVARVWPLINSQNIEELTDLDGYRRDFYAIFGFGRPDVDYAAEVQA